ncbi:hypothetical protein B7494_g7767 [Chlorociboria aeruginascens]|nr:hypothetical protein B7494_g7767 [Chlorociboria aeruginascens]
MASRTERFQRPSRDPKTKSQDIASEPEEVIRFPAEQEAVCSPHLPGVPSPSLQAKDLHIQTLLSESNTQKAAANALFAKSEFKDAIEKYGEALATCPNYLDYEIAVLKSNVSACYLKLEDWKEAAKAAGDALDGLDRLRGKDGEKGEEEKHEEADEEIISEGATKSEVVVEKSERERDIERIRTKALMRRARARSELGGWASLQGAEEVRVNWLEDYKTLSQTPNLSAADRKIIQSQLVQLPPRTKAAQEKEMGEMMGKLKSLGNGILKPFGLSTDNFQMVKDEKTGGYTWPSFTPPPPPPPH